MATLSNATGAVYRIPTVPATCIQEISQANVRSLIGALQLDATEHTHITLKREQPSSYVMEARYPRAVIAGRMGLIAEAALVLEPTPFTILEAGHGGMVELEMFERPLAPEPPAYKAFKDLVRWLDADDALVADMVGIGRTTPYAWKRDGREPRAATTQRIYEDHATLDSLRRRLGGAGLRRWLYGGQPSRREVLLGGDLEALDADVHAVLFHRAPEDRVDLAAAPEETVAAPRVPIGNPVRPSGRRPRRPAR